MDITIYRVPDGRYVLVPQVFQPSMECRKRFETLHDCGQFRIADVVDSAMWEQVLADIASDSYAVLDHAVARELLGPAHQCLAADVSVGGTHASQAPSSGAMGWGAAAWDESTG